MLYIDYRQTDFPPLMSGESCLSDLAQQTQNARELKYIPPASHRMGNFCFIKTGGDSNDHNCLPRLAHIHSSISYRLCLLPSSESWLSLVLSPFWFTLSAFFFSPNCWFRVQPRFPSYPTLRSLCTVTFKLLPNLPPRASIFSSFSTCSIYKASLPSVLLLSSTYLSSAVLTISRSLPPSPVMST